MTMTTTEAAEILDVHDAYGRDALWANYPELSLPELRELYETAIMTEEED